MTQKFQLINARQMNNEFPETFQIPTNEEIAQVAAGSLVKLGFEQPDITERMWVIVKSCHPSGYVGVLDNEPVSQSGVLTCGVQVFFGPEHILSIDQSFN